jgi:hypothetical protein
VTLCPYPEHKGRKEGRMKKATTTDEELLRRETQQQL